ncbi:hypothetical protein EDB19DRAFT_1916291 [Suillus lakei]|nr:hypothetical protein EDB19DRAFT_1916291 [Suillus lakei]
MSRQQCCNCTSNNCRGALLAAHVARSHERADLLQQTLASQSTFKRVGARIVPSQPDPGLVPHGFAVPLRENSPTVSLHYEPHFSESAVLDYGNLMEQDLDTTNDLPSMGPNFRTPEALLGAVDHFEAYNAATAGGSRPLSPNKAYRLAPDPEQEDFQHLLREALEKETDDSDELAAEFLGDEDQHDANQFEDIFGPAQEGEDNPDPFFVPDGLEEEGATDLKHLPPHLLSVYAVVSWLHLQYHLPQAACNALLSIFACILLFISPRIELPFVTLPSSNRVLGIDSSIYILAVCPSCRNVFPPACSPHSQDTCPTCHLDLFLPDENARGNQRANKTPIVRYPYLPLSDQLKSLLKIPGLERLLDDWRSKPRAPNQYRDIQWLKKLSTCLRYFDCLHHCTRMDRYSQDILPWPGSTTSGLQNEPLPVGIGGHMVAL